MGGVDFMDNKKTKKDMAKILVNQSIDSLSQDELIDLILDKTVGVDVDKECELNKSTSQKFADIFTSFLGTWKFIFIFSGFLLFWIIINLCFIKTDPYPFILLNLVLSCVAALQAPVIMMSQNREADRERKRNQNDYKIDLKSELILEVLYDQMEEIRKNQKIIIKKLNESSDSTQK